MTNQEDQRYSILATLANIQTHRWHLMAYNKEH
jgi:hypothetical protein